MTLIGVRRQPQKENLLLLDSVQVRIATKQNGIIDKCERRKGASLAVSKLVLGNFLVFSAWLNDGCLASFVLKIDQTVGEGWRRS